MQQQPQNSLKKYKMPKTKPKPKDCEQLPPEPPKFNVKKLE
jgi:hypothetical protein